MSIAQETGQLSVSRETLQKLKDFQFLIEKWTKRINLIAPSSIPHIWERHILDSVQISDLAPEGWSTWLDLGSGGGLPGIVVSILSEPDQLVTLVESDARKAVFLRTAVREANLNAVVVHDRIEALEPAKYDVVSARALASLPVLLGFASKFLNDDGVALFPKGRQYQTELKEAQKNWNFDVDEIASRTDTEARILRLTRIEQREP